MSHSQPVLDQHTRQFYIAILKLLKETEFPFMVGGAYALAQYTGIERHTKDLDIFVLKKDAEKILDVLSSAGYKAELTFPHWLGKAFKGDNFIDLIFSSGNGIADVDEDWLRYATRAEVFGVPVFLCPPEEMLWSKGYIMERERFDGGDVAHILHACAETLDWNRLIMRFDSHYRILLAHLILFGFIYPLEENKIPEYVMDQLLERLRADSQQHPVVEEVKLCQGTILSREQYLVDVERWGYHDARLKPLGNMSASEISHWTLAINNK